MYDIKPIFHHAKKNRETGNSYLLKESERYIGFIYISNLNNKHRAISLMIEKSMRNCGYGKIVLNSVSEYLFREKLADSVIVYIKDKNKNSINMARSCRFEQMGKLDIGDTTIYERRK